MTLNQEVEIIYLYIVEGLSMENVGKSTGWETSVISETVRDYGFNNDSHQRSGWQSGKDRGRYARGKAATRGVNVTRQLIRDFLQCADEWEWDFEWYISEIAKDIAEQNRSHQQQQQQRAAQQQREMQQRLQAEQNARQERERREREAREQQIRQQEYQRQQKEQEQKNTKEYYRLTDIGKKALKEGRLQQALNSFYDARKLFDAIELYALIAEVLAKSENADTHCQSIIRELREYENCIKRDNKALTEEQLLWYARALVTDKQTSGAINRYAMAADIAYNNKDYIRADAIYKECYSKTGYYCSDNPDHAFNVAYARSCVKNITADDHRFCIDMYRNALKGQNLYPTVYGNIAWHYVKLGEYDNAISNANSALTFGNHQKYVYGNLLDAYFMKKDYKAAYDTINNMEKKEYKCEPWQKAECIYLGKLLGEQSEQKACELYKKQIETTGTHIHSCYRLLYICKDDNEAVLYGLRYLELQKSTDAQYQKCAGYVLERADKTGNKYLIDKALEYNLAEKVRRNEQEYMKKYLAEQEEREKKQQRLIREQQEKQAKLAEEAKRKEEQQRRLEEEKRRKEEEQHRLEEERKQEEQRQMELAKQKAEEEMLMLLF